MADQEKHKQYLQSILDKEKLRRSLLTTVNIGEDEYALFDNGDICQVMQDGKLKKINDIVDKDNRLRNRILKFFDNRYTSDVIYTAESPEASNPSNFTLEDVDLPEL